MNQLSVSEQLHMLLLDELSIYEYRVAGWACRLKLGRDSTDAIFGRQVLLLLRNDFSERDHEASLVEETLDHTLRFDVKLLITLTLLLVLRLSFIISSYI